MSKPYKQRWVFRSGGNQQSCRVLRREQSAAQRQQNQGGDCWFQEEGGRVAHPRLHQLNSFSSLGISVTEDLSWPSHITTLGKNKNWEKRWRRTKGCFLKKLKKDTFQSQIHVSFYRGTIKSISDRKIRNWHGSCMAHGQERLCSVWLILPGTSLAPIDRASAIRMKWNVCTEHRRQHPSWLQSVHRAAVTLQPCCCQMSFW